MSKVVNMEITDIWYKYEKFKKQASVYLTLGGKNNNNIQSSY